MDFFPYVSTLTTTVLADIPELTQDPYLLLPGVFILSGKIMGFCKGVYTIYPPSFWVTGGPKLILYLMVMTRLYIMVMTR